MKEIIILITGYLIGRLIELAIKDIIYNNIKKTSHKNEYKRAK
jgi:hypothetical protein